MKLIYPAYFKQATDNCYIVYIPDLGLRKRTDTSNMYLAMEKVAHDACVFIISNFGDAYHAPKPSSVQSQTDNEELGFLNYLVIDLGGFAKKYATRSVKKTLSIPSWLNNLAEEKNINFSRVLQKALKNELNQQEPPEIDCNSEGLSVALPEGYRIHEKTYDIN